MHFASNRLLTILFLLIILISTLASAKEAQPAAHESQPASEPPDPASSFAVDVNVVNLFFAVKDKHGLPVRDLTQNDFEVFEDGKPQKIKYFQADATQPLTLGLLVDTSGSARPLLPLIRSLGVQFFTKVLREKDLAFVMSFDVGVDLLQDLTSPSPDLTAAVLDTSSNGGDSVLPNKEGVPDPRLGSRGTLLYDAIYLAATQELKHEVGRKTIVIITDGIDQGSETSIAATIEAAQRVDASVYVLLAHDPEYGARSEDIGRICRETGGRVIDVGLTGNVEKAIRQVSEELQTQYYIGYTPTQKPDGAFRRLQVRVKSGDLHVQLRKGYYAPKTSGANDANGDAGARSQNETPALP
jgi:VWFA-related protein